MTARSAGVGEKSVTLYYEGRPVPSRPGISVAASLAEAGIAALRTAAEGDRGLFCGMGVCGECSMIIDGQTSQLSCMVMAAEGMQVRRQPARVPVETETVPAPIPEGELIPELLVVGGGPAGLAAALSAARAGVSVVLVDERAKLGGQYYKQPPNFETDERLDAQFIAGHDLIEAVQAAGVHVLSGTRLWSAEVPSVDGNGEPVLEFFAAGETQRWIIRPRRLVLATGAYEKVLPFPGWTLPGVMSTGAGQSLVRAYRVAPGQRVLVAGNGPLNMQLAAELTRSGAEVVALAELARFTSPRHALRMARMALAVPSLVRDGARYIATLRRGRVLRLSGYTVIRADGEEKVERVTLARIGPDGTPVAGSERSFEVDAVCLGFGFLSGNEIARLLGVEHNLDAASGSYVVKSSAHGRTNVAGVWAVGDGAQVRGAKVAERMGSLAGADVALDLGYTPDAASIQHDEKVLARHERFQEALWQVYAGPQVGSRLAEPETLICRCESVTLGAIDASLYGICSAGALKRLTRVGMGRCQGRFCGPTVIDRVAQATGEPVNPLSGFAPQPPFRPVPAGLIAADDPRQPRG